jgi:Na+-driven multidrug efflux pump
MFLGLSPIGNFEIGFLTERVGVAWAFTINAVIVLLFGLLVFMYRKRIRERYRAYKEVNALNG